MVVKEKMEKRSSKLGKFGLLFLGTFRGWFRVVVGSCPPSVTGVVFGVSQGGSFWKAAEVLVGCSFCEFIKLLNLDPS